jgi:peptide/nickel transport system substrate-binding protein
MRRWVLAAALAMVSLLFGVVAEARTVRWAESGDPNTMDPRSQNLGTVTMVLQQIYDPLIHEMIPWAVRGNLSIRHMANNPPCFRWAVVS